MSNKEQKAGSLFVVGLIVLMCLMAGVMWMQKTEPGGTDMAGGPFTLIDHNGKAVTDASYKAPYKLVFFGFTSCEAICPGELKKMALVLEALGPLADDIQPLFITVDPDTDTPETMKNYVEMFNPRIVGLTGTSEQLRTVHEEYKVYSAKVENKVSGGHTMDHSSYTYLIGPDNKLTALFNMQTGPQEMTDEIKKILESRS
ncbi:MAG: SCO family protein [Rhodospirillales bacterium]|nr:SCO family protein [Rhodospirillales bacterium]